jgi:regulator of protease activity HflC (stomatin/prohibitin superfamily)
MPDLFTLALALAAPVVVFLVVRARLVRVVVSPAEAVVLVRNGELRGVLPVGVHRYFGGVVEVTRFDLRECLQRVVNQEVPTADQVPVRFSLQVRRRVAEPLVLFGAVQDVQDHVHAAAQIALREAVAEMTLEQLFADRGAVAARVQAALAPRLAEVGITLVAAALQDIGVPGELKRAYGDVAKARAEGAARLERARAEAAALRSMANSARLMQEHPGLDRLLTLGIARSAAERNGGTLVLGLEDPRRGAELAS